MHLTHLRVILVTIVCITLVVTTDLHLTFGWMMDNGGDDIVMGQSRYVLVSFFNCLVYSLCGVLIQMTNDHIKIHLDHIV